MRQFLRVLKYSWPYRFRLLGSIACALFVAALWSLDLSAIYPVLNILQTGKNLQQWVDGEIDDYQKKLDDKKRRIDLEDAKQQLAYLEAHPGTPNGENLERKATQRLAKLEGENNHYAT